MGTYPCKTHSFIHKTISSEQMNQSSDQSSYNNELHRNATVYVKKDNGQREVTLYFKIYYYNIGIFIIKAFCKLKMLQMRDFQRKTILEKAKESDARKNTSVVGTSAISQVTILGETLEIKILWYTDYRRDAF